MHAVMTWVAATAVSISAGWERLPNGGYEYIIQIEPEAIATLEAGEEFTSEIPPEAREVRSYRIRVGRDVLPRESGSPLAIPPPPADATISLEPPPTMPPDAEHPTATTDPSNPNLAPADATAGHEAGPRKAGPRGVGIHADGAEGGPRMAEFHEGKAAASTAADGPSSGAPPAGGASDQPAKPALWAPLFGSLLALFASVGGNVFLGWTAVSMRGRYKALLAHTQPA